MHMVGWRIGGGFKVWIGQEFFVRSVGHGYAQLAGRGFGQVAVARSDGGDFAPFAFLHCRRNFKHTNLCSAKNSPSDFLRHGDNLQHEAPGRQAYQRVQPQSVTPGVLREPRGDEASRPGLLPVQCPGRIYRAGAGYDQRWGEERPGLSGRTDYRPCALNVAMMSEIPGIRKDWALKQVRRLIRRIRTITPQRSAPVVLSSRHNPGDRIAGSKGRFQDVITPRGKHRYLAHSGDNILVLIAEAGIVNGACHHGDCFEINVRKISNGFQHHPRTQAMGGKRKCIGPFELNSQMLGQQPSTSNRLVIFERIIDDGYPARITRPQKSDKKAVGSQPQPLIPVIQIADSVRPAHIEAMCAQQNIPALDRLDEIRLQRGRWVRIGLRIRAYHNVTNMRAGIAARGVRAKINEVGQGIISSRTARLLHPTGSRWRGPSRLEPTAWPEVLRRQLSKSSDM